MCKAKLHPSSANSHTLGIGHNIGSKKARILCTMPHNLRGSLRNVGNGHILDRSRFESLLSSHIQGI